MFLHTRERQRPSSAACAATHHGQEDSELGIHGNDVTVGEGEGLAALLLARVNHRDLLRRHRQHWELNAVELIEAAPRPGLG